MNDDIITRLQDIAFRLHPDSDVGSALCDAADEIWELHSLITAWADADIAWADAPEPWKSDTAQKYTDAVMALRAKVGR